MTPEAQEAVVGLGTMLLLLIAYAWAKWNIDRRGGPR